MTTLKGPVLTPTTEELMQRIQRLEWMMKSLGWEKALDNRLRCSPGYRAMCEDLAKGDR
jgi:hypothetical protein